MTRPAASNVTLIGGPRDGEIIAIPDALTILETPMLHLREPKKHFEDVDRDDAVKIETCRYRRSAEDRLRFVFEE